MNKCLYIPKEKIQGLLDSMTAEQKAVIFSRRAKKDADELSFLVKRFINKGHNEEVNQIIAEGKMLIGDNASKVINAMMEWYKSQSLDKLTMGELEITSDPIKMPAVYNTSIAKRISTSSSNNNGTYEVSTRGDKRFSALNAKFKPGTVIDGQDVGGMTIEDVYQTVIKKSGKGQPPFRTSRLNLNPTNVSEKDRELRKREVIEAYGNPINYKTSEGTITVTFENGELEVIPYAGSIKDSKGVSLGNKDINYFVGALKVVEDLAGGKEDFSYKEGYLPLWQEWAKQNPQLIKELEEKSRGKNLTDSFTNTRVSQARALTDILKEYRSENGIKETESKATGTKEKITDDGNTIYVYGSNKDARQLRGRQKIAVQSFGASRSSRTGLSGRSFAITLKGGEVTEKSQIAHQFKQLISIASQMPNMQFKIAFNTTDDAEMDAYTGRELIAMLKTAAYSSLTPGEKDEGIKPAIPDNILISNEWAKIWDETPAYDYLKEDATEKERIQATQFSLERLQSSVPYSSIKEITTDILNSVIARLDNAYELEKKRLTDIINNEDIDELDRLDAAYEYAGLNRVSVLNKIGLSSMLDQIKQDMQDFLNKSKEDRLKAIEQRFRELWPQEQTGWVKGYEHYYTISAENFYDTIVQNYQLTLDNFDGFAERVVSQLAQVEHFTAAIGAATYDEIVNRTVDDEGNSIENAIEEKEENIKEGWMEDFRKKSVAESLTTRIKKLYQSIPMVGSNGLIMVDNLGNPKMVNPEQVHHLVQYYLKDMLDPEDLMQSLYEMAQDKPFLKSLVDRINDDEVLQAQMYSVYRTDQFNYWTSSIKKDSIAYNVKSADLNGVYGNNAYFNSWRNNQEYGIQLVKEEKYKEVDWHPNWSDAPEVYYTGSMYDSNGDLDGLHVRGNWTFLLELMNEIESLAKDNEVTFTYMEDGIEKQGVVGTGWLTDAMNYYDDAESEQAYIAMMRVLNGREDIKEKIVRALRIVGIDVNMQQLEDVININTDRELKKFWPALGTMLQSLKYIYKNCMETEGLKTNLHNVNGEELDDNRMSDLKVIKKYRDFINANGGDFNNIASILNVIDDNTLERGARVGSNYYNAMVKPSYLTTLVKRMKRIDKVGALLDQYRECDWFYEEGTGFKNMILELLDMEDSGSAREKEGMPRHGNNKAFAGFWMSDRLQHIQMLQYNGKQYNEWNAKDVFRIMLGQYLRGQVLGRDADEMMDTWAYYLFPVLSDTESAEFLRLPRFGYINYNAKLKDNSRAESHRKYEYKEALLDRFTTLVHQELDRIDKVNDRAALEESPVDNFDRVGNKKGGAEFKFFPELNTYKRTYTLNGVKGEYTLREMIDAATEANKGNDELEDSINSVIKDYVEDIMDERFSEFKEFLDSINAYESVLSRDGRTYYNKYFDKYTEEEFQDLVENFFWNHTYMQSQMIQLTGVDLAFFKNFEDFQKRNQMFHAPTQKLYTLATFNGDPAAVYSRDYTDSAGNLIHKKGDRRTDFRSITLRDNFKNAADIENIRKALYKRVRTADNPNGDLTKKEADVLLGIYEKNNSTDGQAYRTLPSYRSLMVMSGNWDDAKEKAFNNIMQGKFVAADILCLLNTVKPTLCSVHNIDDGVGGRMRVPVRQKDSEMILAVQAIFGQLLNDSKLKALNDFMIKNDIDVAVFGSGVKTGARNVIDISDEAIPSKGSNLAGNVTNALNNALAGNSDIVEEHAMADYGIQTSTPIHSVDADVLVGNQITRIMQADQNIFNDPNYSYTLNGKKLPLDEWNNLFNAVYFGNLKDAYTKLEKIFGSKQRLSEELITEIKTNPRYSDDLIEALQIDPLTGDFNVPIDDSTMSIKFQALLNSFFKNRITKHRINGATYIQATAFGLSEEEKPRIKYKNNDASQGIEYVECYVTCPSKELYEVLRKNGTQELDINVKYVDENGKEQYIIPREWLNFVGFRVPTEAKYSTIPLHIKGFLPNIMGSVIMMPEEITTITGSDFDKH